MIKMGQQSTDARDLWERSAAEEWCFFKAMTSQSSVTWSLRSQMCGG
jgi:hypothetical protein